LTANTPIQVKKAKNVSIFCKKAFNIKKGKIRNIKDIKKTVIDPSTNDSFLRRVCNFSFKA